MTPPNRELVIVTPRLTLRATRITDVPRLVEIQSNWNVTQMLRMAPWPANAPDMTAWLFTHPGEWSEGTAYRFTILASDQIIGLCDLDEIADRCGDIGYWLDEAHWGRGYGLEAATAVRDFGLQTLGLRRLKSGHASENKASGKILQHLGFRPTEQTLKFSRPRGCDWPHQSYALDATGDPA